MKTFSNYTDLFNATDNQLTAQQIINRQVYLKDGGWSKIELTEDFYNSFAEELSQLLGGRYKTREMVYRSIKYGYPQHWGLSRVLIEFYAGWSSPRLSYCAGQDYTAELAQIRTALK